MLQKTSDIDPIETAEWREAFQGVVGLYGPERARYLLDQLVALAHSLVACGVIDETELQDRLAPSGPGWNPDRKTGCKQARQRVDRGP